MAQAAEAQQRASATSSLGQDSEQEEGEGEEEDEEGEGEEATVEIEEGALGGGGLGHVGSTSSLHKRPGSLGGSGGRKGKKGQGPASSSQHQQQHQHPPPFSSLHGHHHPYAAAVAPQQPPGEDAALGSHIALIALSVFLGYLLNLSLKYLELNREFLRNHHLISVRVLCGIFFWVVGCWRGVDDVSRFGVGLTHASKRIHVQGIRLFKICMVAAVVCMTTLRSLSNIRCVPFF